MQSKLMIKVHILGSIIQHFPFVRLMTVVDLRQDLRSKMKCGQRRRRVKTFNFDANQLSAVDLEKSNSSQLSEREKRANSIENRVWNWFWRNLQFHTIYHLSPAYSDSDWKVRIFGMHRKLILQFERVEKKFSEFPQSIFCCEFEGWREKKVLMRTRLGWRTWKLNFPVSCKARNEVEL